mmetsp:Transcript_17245/g.51170  ORF Transcript_17245/g.51170 Transcript_17245/m.51170 type:complete len:202 (+) Transcript_17245:273-878(+)
MASAQAKEMMPIMARRPFLSSASWISLNFAGSWVTRGTPKSPPHSAAGYLFSQYTSSAPMAAIICQMPAAGTFAAPSSGPAAATSANETPDEVESIPSKWVPVAVHNHPTVASIATRQCLSSAARTSFKLDSSMFSESLSGSHTLLDTSVDAPTRSVTASMDGEADRTADRGASGAAKPHAVGEASESMVQIPTQIVTSPT